MLEGNAVGGSVLVDSSHNWDEIAGFVVQSVCQLLIVRNQVGNVDVAVVLLGQHIFADLVSVDEDIVEHKVQDEVDELFLRRFVARLPVDGGFSKQAEGICRLAIHRGRCGGRWVVVVVFVGTIQAERMCSAERETEFWRDAKDEPEYASWRRKAVGQWGGISFKIALSLR